MGVPVPQRCALAVCGLLTLAAWGLVAVSTERPFFFDQRVPPGRGQRAALAIRDDVIPFQKWGSKIFTEGYLHRYYHGAWYFTQSAADSREAEFTECLSRALERYDAVDLLLLAHTNKYLEWVAALPPEHRSRLRMVYNTGCHNLNQGPRWLELGADAYVGHPGESSSSVFYVYFLRRWRRGWPLDRNVEASNRLMDRAFREYALLPFNDAAPAMLMRESTAVLHGRAGLTIAGETP